MVIEPLINAHNGMKVYKLSDKLIPVNEIKLESEELADLADNGE